MARALKFVILSAPVLFSAWVAWLLGRIIPPAVVGIPTLPWFAGVTVLATVSLIVAERLLRRVAPLPVLLSLALVFPDDAPSRYRIALKTGSTRQVARRIEEIRATGMALDSEQNYAEQMLELLALLSAHDRLTRGHCERVRAYTDLIIEELGIPERDAARLRWAALLHDLGKLMVPSEILNKPGKPTDEEWEILKSHTWQGDRMAEPLAEWLGEWKAAIGQHHERWDGGGYPNGLAGEDIHLGARIVAVADTYDVMTSARSYKKPLPAEVAREEIARCAGGQFDPEVARAFLTVAVSRLRFVAGPLSWLTSWMGVSSVTTAGTSTLAAGASASGAIITAVASVVAPGALWSADPVEEALAYVAVEADSDEPVDAVAEPTMVEAEPVAVVSGKLAAGPDLIEVAEGEAVVFDVLINDVSPDGGLAVSEFTAASAGDVTFDGRLFHYHHNGSETHDDGFSYMVSTADGASAEGLVSVAITPVNDPPRLVPAEFYVERTAKAGDSIGNIAVEDPDSTIILFATESEQVAVDAEGHGRLRVDAASIDGSVDFEVTATDDDGASSSERYRVRVGTAPATTTSTTSASPSSSSQTTSSSGGVTTSTITSTTTSTTTSNTTSTTGATTTTTTTPPTTTTTTTAPTTTTTAPTTTTAAPGGAGLVVSEFSTAGANPDGDFVELYNGTGAAVDLTTVDVDLLNNSGVFETVDLGTGSLPAGAHYLLAKSGSALAGTADVTFSTSLPLSFAAAVDGPSGYLDVVGTRNRPENKPSVVPASATMEGTGVPPFDPDSTSNPQSFVRRYGTTGGACVDTDDNSADFIRSFHSAGVTPTASTAGTFGCGSAGSSPGTPLTVVISEIRTDGPGGGSNEFVELFNPTGSPEPLAGLQLVRDDGDQVQYLFTTEVIPAGKRLLLAHPDFTGPTPDLTYIGGGVKNGGGLTLEVAAGGAEIDRVAFGSASPELPPLGGRLQHSYSRRYSGCIDTGTYYVDFEHTLTETPQGLSAPATTC